MGSMAQDAPSIDHLLAHAYFARRLARALVLDDARADDVVQQAWVSALFFDERTPTEIATAQSIPVRTVETRLRRALEQLRADLDRRFAGGRDAWAGLLLPLGTVGTIGGAVVATKTSVGIVAAAAV